MTKNGPVQPVFSFEEPLKRGSQVSLTARSSAPLVSPPTGPVAYRQALVEQVIRDTQTIDGDPEYHVPSLEFYFDRVASFKEALRELDA